MGSVAEWSKALVLGTSLPGGVGSNPTAAKSFGKNIPDSYFKRKWRCGGSNPGPLACKASALPLSYIPSTQRYSKAAMAEWLRRWT